MNEHEIYFQANNNAQLQIVQLEFTSRKYKVKLNAEAANLGIL